MPKRLSDKVLMQAIAKNDRAETEWSDFLKEAKASHLVDIFEDLRVTEEALRIGTMPEMMDTVGFMCCQPISVPAIRLAIGLAVIRVRVELIARANGPTEDGSPSRSPDDSD